MHDRNFFIEYEHVPVLLVTTVVFRANYQYISLDSKQNSYPMHQIAYLSL